MRSPSSFRSSTEAMQLWSSRAAMRASSMKLRTNDGSEAVSGCSTRSSTFWLRMAAFSAKYESAERPCRSRPLMM